MFHRVEGEPSEGPHGRLGPSPNLGPSAAPVRLVDYLAVRSILMYSSMVHMMAGMGREPSSLGTWLQEAPLQDEEGEYSHRGGQHAAAPRLKRRHPSGLAFIDQQAHEPVVEDQYLRTLLVGIGTKDIPPVPKESPPPSTKSGPVSTTGWKGFAALRNRSARRMAWWSRRLASPVSSVCL